ncbi:hypothetical protein [Paraflavitalea speifideaquila]|uniref:hypothetical protein n=1 Tax=Paraflavitalea speifideaquila TaxID=3076558 RepID=UPI0028E88063|nr:hypothetical protein [Paraflavitalea speifideiaquila]
MAYSMPATNCIALANASKVDELIQLNKEAVIQDYSSQRVGELLKVEGWPRPGIPVWDCCAASGGKSILACDILGKIDLIVSDIRESIIVNLKSALPKQGSPNMGLLLLILVMGMSGCH